MNAASTSLEAGLPRRAAGSTENEATGRHIVRVLPLSAATLQAMSSDILFAQRPDLRAAHEKNWANANATTGVMTRQFAEGTGESWTFESPTLRLNTEVFETGRFLEPIPGEVFVTNIRFAPSSGFMVVRVAGLGTAAQPIAHAPGLLNSTDRVQGVSRFVESKFAEAVALAGQEWFEDGIESEFARALSTLLHTYKDAAVAPIEAFLRSPSTNVEVAVEAAAWLGKVDHPASRRYRRILLEQVLLGDSSSVRLRHGAATGLASMDDPSSLPAVEAARDRETNQRLQYFLQLVADQLERTRACPSS